jgi:F-type H+-transporting ATPase subunit b
VLIDWFTVGAQIVNFIILIYLLKRFLYKPILRAMDERERKIARRLQEAEEKRRKAEADAGELERQRLELEENREKMQAEAKKEIEQWREEAMEKARQEVEKTRTSWHENLEREKDDFIRSMKNVLSRQVFRAAAKALQDLADARLEAKLVDRFREKFAEAAKGDDGKRMGDRLQVRSGFALNKEQQQAVSDAANEFLAGAEVEFDVEPEMGYGILITGNSRKFEWSLGRYMEEMEKDILGAMSATGGREAGNEPE